jgi:hypothetical protein
MPTQRKKGNGKLKFDPFKSKADLINKAKINQANAGVKLANTPRRTGSRGS